MLRWRMRMRRMIYLFTDLVCIMFASVVAHITFTRLFNKQLDITSLEHIGFLSISTLIFMGVFLMMTIYDNTIEENGRLSMKIIIKMLIGYGLAFILLGAGLFYLKVNISRLYIGTFTTFIMIFQLVNRAILHSTQFQSDNKSEAMRNILVVGQSKRGSEYIAEIQKHNYLNLNIVGYMSIKEPNHYAKIGHLGSIDQLVEIATAYVIDEIAVARPLSYDPRLEELLKQCQSMGITISMILDVQSNQKAQVAMVGNIPVLKFHTVSLNESQILMKRLLDISGAIIGLIPFTIAYIIIGPLIKMESPGPIIFKQDRVGKNGRVFKVWKFRSMGVDAESKKAALASSNEMSGHMFKMTDDPRITKIGDFIRKTSIDELPQFYNVLKGDMSLVGTRPPTVNEVKTYEQHHRRRICITPGITGNWQVSGRSDIEDFEEVVRLDSAYIESWSIWSDIHILIKTVWVVIAGRGSK